MAASKYSAGIHAANRLLKSMPDKVRKLYLDERSKNPRLTELKVRAREAGIQTQGARSHRLDDMAQGTAHQGVVIELIDLPNIDEAALRAKIESALAAGEKPLLLVLVGVQDPHNLGACLRTAEAAGVTAVVVPRARATGLTPAARKVASGAAEILPLVAVPSIARALDWIGSYGIQRIATSDAASGSLYACDYRAPTALVMGTEGDGLSPEIMQRCDQTIAIPMAGVVESLNVSVATAVCLYEAVRQRSA
ncbi:MAG: 23S rRNA (guanosine(2251)-2'-O)-methyltransferase RlmB [Pseudomonadota bacterium]